MGVQFNPRGRCDPRRVEKVMARTRCESGPGHDNQTARKNQEVSPQLLCRRSGLFFTFFTFFFRFGLNEFWPRVNDFVIHDKFGFNVAILV